MEQARITPQTSDNSLTNDQLDDMLVDILRIAIKEYKKKSPSC